MIRPFYALWRLLEPEVLATVDAFNAYPPDARRRHFLRRTKEEMVRFEGKRIYPARISETLSYNLSQGEVSEQSLYDQTTAYIDHYYHRARILNRSAARLAMSVFQRRLASSTYALLRSFERRLETLNALIESIRSGKLRSPSRWPTRGAALAWRACRNGWNSSRGGTRIKTPNSPRRGASSARRPRRAPRAR